MTRGALLLAWTIGTGVLVAQQTNPPPAATPRPIIELTGPFPDGAPIPPKYTCLAQPSPVSPQLQWVDEPAGTISFVLIFHDAELHPRKGIDDILHWMVWNIPANVHQLPEGLPPNAELENGTRQNKTATRTGYLAPCAPVGKAHHYIFQLYALDQKLDLPPEAAREDLRKAMDGHILGEGLLIGRFHK